MVFGKDCKRAPEDSYMGIWAGFMEEATSQMGEGRWQEREEQEQRWGVCGATFGERARY